MAEEIKPTLPLTGTIPTHAPPEDKRRDPANKKPAETTQEDEKEDVPPKPKHGLFDEYV